MNSARACFSWIGNHRRLVAVLLALLLVVCIALTRQVRFNHDIAVLLPADPVLQREVSFIRNSAFAGKVVLFFELEGSGASLDDLIAYADKVAGRLPNDLVTGITRGPRLAPRDMERFIAYAATLVGRERLAAFAGRLTPGPIGAALEKAKSVFLSFQGMAAGAVLRLDPLGLFSPEVRHLEKLASVFGKNIVVHRGHFVSKDLRGVLLLLDTPVVLTDSAGSRELLAHVRSAFDDAPAWARVGLVAGHTHTLANETVLKRDVARTSMVAACVFLIVLVWFFRDLRAAVFFLIPAAAVLVALVLSQTVFGEVSAFIAALSGLIIGIADDYGIHVYMAIRTGTRRDAVWHVARPVILSALCTSGILSVFFLSQVTGYRQLAFFGTVSIWLCVGCVLFLFPHTVTTAPLPWKKRNDRAFSRRGDRWAAALWVILTVVCLCGAGRLRFSGDMTALDAVDAETLRNEKRFEEVWTAGEHRGMLVAGAGSREEAIAENRRLYEEAGVYQEQMISIAPLLVSGRERTEHIRAWKDFWDPGRREAVKRAFVSKGAAHGFSEDAFVPFFRLAAESVFPAAGDIPFLGELSERFIREEGGGWQVISFFNETPANNRYFSALAERSPGAFVFSPRVFVRRLSGSINQEARRLALYAAVLLGAGALFFLRKLRLVLIGLSAAASCIAAVAGVYGHFDMPLTAPAVIALMIAAGLSIDYGFFMLYSFLHDADTGASKAVHISAVTTLVGAFSLLVARHPALFTIGLSLSTGLGAGWLCAQYVIPALYRLWG
ncbi:MAG: MMPL family transporter, partial [Candidatus Omnitrophica bacterium]|nr:MMPL family transporter [Candidatus Omnitrophota bacterium]